MSVVNMDGFAEGDNPSLNRINWKERPDLQEIVNSGAEGKWPVTGFLASVASFTTDGMLRMTLEQQTMDAERTVETPFGTCPMFHLTSLPLPITHSTTVFVSKVGECAAEVALAVEQSVLGRRHVPKGEFQILGLCNHPKRFVTCGMYMDLERRIKVLKDAGWYGPYLQVVNAPDGRAAETHESIQRTIRSEHLDPQESVLVQLTPDCIEIVEGFRLQAVSNGSGQIKVLCIRVPRIRECSKGTVGILHNTREKE